MKLIHWSAMLGRGLVLFVFLCGALGVYGAGRTWLAVVARAERHTRIARWRGRVLRRSMTMPGATFIKIGQVMSSRPDLLAPEVIAELKVLLDQLPPFPFARARALIEADLGKPLERIYAEFERVPLPAASVAQVHRARLPGGREVAVKVLRPNVRRQVERDSAVLLFFARLLALHPTLRINDPVGHVRHFTAILRQTDLRVEAANYEQFRRISPTSSAWCSPRSMARRRGARC